jgi:hypothetical protein
LRLSVCLAFTRALGSIGYHPCLHEKTLREKQAEIPKECQCSSLGEARKSRRESGRTPGPPLATEAGKPSDFPHSG